MVGMLIMIASVVVIGIITNRYHRKSNEKYDEYREGLEKTLQTDIE